jgi:hypothetical protein
MIKETIPFNKQGTSGKSICLIGDSSIYGVGATQNRYSVSGYISEKFPEYQIDTFGFPEAKIVDLKEKMCKIPDNSHYEYLLIVIGANDIVMFTKEEKVINDLQQIIIAVKKIAKKVFITHAGNVGAIRLFPFPMRHIYSRRTLMFRSLYLNLAKEYEVHYVDMYTTIADFPYFYNGKSVFAKDLFHPSNEGYRLWSDLFIKDINA